VEKKSATAVKLSAKAANYKAATRLVSVSIGQKKTATQ
jgi:hypothetical protein